jgi:hypothetical protein
MIRSITFLSFALLISACAASSPSAATTSDAITTPTVGAHFTCSADSRWPLELLVGANGGVDATYGGAVVLSGALHSGEANLGSFLSGEYSIELDAALLAGKAGTAVLADDGGPKNGGTTSSAYACAPAAPVATAFDCTASDSSQYPLSITTAADGKVVAAYAGGAISWDGKLTGGDSNLGEFLSGEYALHVDTDILDGREGNATLFDDEGPKNGGVTPIAYRCTPKK